MVAFRPVVEPHDTSLALTGADEFEISIREQVRGRFCDWRQERFDRLFAIDTTYAKVPGVVCFEFRMARSFFQEPIKCH